MVNIRNLGKNNAAVGTKLDAAIAFSLVVILITAFWVSAQNLYTPQLTDAQYSNEIQQVFETLSSTAGQATDGTPGVPSDPNLITKLGLAINKPCVYGSADIDPSTGDISEVLRRYTYGDYTWSGMNTCLVGGTKIVMADGTTKNIEDITLGDIVRSYDETTQQIVEGTVTDVTQHPAEEMSNYYIVINDEIKLTPNHRLFVDNDWVYAQDLHVGDTLFHPSEETRITSIKRIYENVPTYDIEVEGSHNYFIATNSPQVPKQKLNKAGILVHNNEVPHRPSVDPPMDVYTKCDDILNLNTNLSYTFNMKSYDPDGTEIWYQVLWGDGSFSQTDVVPEGTWISQNHTYTIPGDYSLEVYAWDTHPSRSFVRTIPVHVENYTYASYTWEAMDNTGTSRWVTFNLTNCHSHHIPEWHYAIYWDLNYTGTFDTTYYDWQGAYGPGSEHDIELSNYGDNQVAMYFWVGGWKNWPREYYNCDSRYIYLKEFSNIFVDTVSVYWDQPPNANFTWADNDGGGPGMAIDFDATVSTDDITTRDPATDGIVKIEWDFDYTGTFSTPESNVYSKTKGNLDDGWQVQYPGLGQEQEYAVALRVTDYAGQSDIYFVNNVSGSYDTGQEAQFVYWDADGYGEDQKNITVNATSSIKDEDYDWDMVAWDWDANGALDDISNSPPFYWEMTHEFNSGTYHDMALLVYTTQPFPNYDYKYDTVCALPEPQFTWYDADGYGPGTTIVVDPINSSYPGQDSWGQDFEDRGSPDPGFVLWFDVDWSPPSNPKLWPNAISDGDTWYNNFVNNLSWPTDNFQLNLNTIERTYPDTNPHNFAIMYKTNGGDFYIVNHTVCASYDPLPHADFFAIDPDQFDTECKVHFNAADFSWDYRNHTDPDYAPYGHNGTIKYEWIIDYPTYNENDPQGGYDEDLFQSLIDNDPEVKYYWQEGTLDDSGNLTDTFIYDFQENQTLHNVAFRVTGGPPHDQTNGTVRQVKAGRSAYATYDWYDKDGIGPDAIISFNASDSIFYGGEIGVYWWDWDGNGALDNFTYQPLNEHDYGDYNKHTTAVLVWPVTGGSGSGFDAYKVYNYYYGQVEAYQPSFTGEDHDYSGPGTRIDFDASSSMNYIQTYNIETWNISKVEWDYEYTPSGVFSADNWTSKTAGNFSLTSSYDYEDDITHIAALRLEDNHGTQSMIVYQEVQANEMPPFSATLEWEDADGDGLGTVINFHAQTNLTLQQEEILNITYCWDWYADNNPSEHDFITNNRNASYDYGDTDEHTVKLKVKDDYDHPPVFIYAGVQASNYPSDDPWLTDGNDTYWHGYLSSKELTLPEDENLYLEYLPIEGSPNTKGYIIYKSQSSQRIIFDYNAVFEHLRNMDYTTFMRSLGLDAQTYGIGLTFSCNNPATNQKQVFNYGLSPNYETQQAIGETITREVNYFRKPLYTSPTNIIHPKMYSGTITIRLIQFYTPQNIHPPNIIQNDSYPIPPDGQTNVQTSPILRVNVTDPDAGDTLTVSFYNALDDTLLGSINQVTDTTGNGTEVSLQLANLAEERRYHWYITVDDGIFQTSSPTWTFITQSSSGIPDMDL